MYGLRRITAPASPPLDLADVRLHLRVADGSFDQYLQTILMPAAAERAEADTHRQLITATWELTLDAFPCAGEPIRLPLGELQEVVSLKYIDAAGDEQTWDDDEYRVLPEKEPAEIWPVYGGTWPVAQFVPAAVKVRFICGYGDTPASLPAMLRFGMLLVIGHCYSNPSAVVTGTIASELPMGAKNIFEQFALGDDFTDYAVTR